MGHPLVWRSKKGQKQEQPQILHCVQDDSGLFRMRVICSGVRMGHSDRGGVEMASFEESLKKLETIVEKLEKGDLALEESLKLFEEGVGLSAACKKELDAAEGKVQMLVKQRDGSLKAEPFEGTGSRE
jgi:exodeoxyribonuclease VII small subunit